MDCAVLVNLWALMTRLIFLGLRLIPTFVAGHKKALILPPNPLWDNGSALALLAHDINAHGWTTHDLNKAFCECGYSEAEGRPFSSPCICISFPSTTKSADSVLSQSPCLCSTVARNSMNKSAVKLSQLVNYRDETTRYLDELHIPSPEMLTIRTSTTTFGRFSCCHCVKLLRRIS